MKTAPVENTQLTIVFNKKLFITQTGKDCGLPWTTRYVPLHFTLHVTEVTLLAEDGFSTSGKDPIKQVLK